MSTNAALYAQDFYTWTQTTAAAIRAGEWQDLDAEMIAEEIESLGISQEHALPSSLNTPHASAQVALPASRGGSLGTPGERLSSMQQ